MTEDGERGTDSKHKTHQGCSLTGILLCTVTEGSAVVFATGCSSLVPFPITHIVFHLENTWETSPGLAPATLTRSRERA
jgi:hypothetical protein